MDDRTQELYDRMADSVRVLPEGETPSPGSMVIEASMSEAEVKKLIRDIPRRNEVSTNPLQLVETEADIETQVRQEVTERQERQQRIQACGEAVKKVFEDYKCTMNPMLKIEGKHYPVESVIGFPVELVIKCR